MNKTLILISVLFLLLPFTVMAQEIDYCEGNFDYNLTVDGLDAAVFKSDFGRSSINNPCPPDGPAPVPKTGQTTSSATGDDDGDLKRGVTWPNPRFTDHGDGTVTDNLTGLIWLKNANCFGTRTLDLAISDCNGLASGSCGLGDGSIAGNWRLPNRNELNSLIDVGYFNPALCNTAGTEHWTSDDPFISVQSGYYWSSTTVAFDADGTWNVYMYSGYVNHVTKADAYHVWPVRGGH